MLIVAGIDVGSRITKAVVLNENRVILGRGKQRTRPNFPLIAGETLEMALGEAGLARSDLCYVATTGFGRYNVPFRDAQITDITCTAKAATFLFPNTRCVLDIGFQSTRAIKVRDGGKVKEFRSNDKCAAGAGGFLERAGKYLEINLEDFGDLSLRAEHPQTISSVCAVLAETEIINHVSAGQTLENIVGGIHLSLASRSQTLLTRIGLEDEVTFVAGVARQAGMVKALEETLKRKVNVCADPEFVSALGAGLLALQRAEKTLAVPKAS
ncbi:MAG: acyl-CoA dehydratase activase [Chloroflexi bacterium]|nr:acyl-CoA dehydratase activase [Chloroflexota bacterium]